MHTQYTAKHYDGHHTLTAISGPHESLEGAKLAAYSYADEHWPQDCLERIAFLASVRIHESYCA